MSEVTLELTDVVAGQAIRNLFPLYLHDLSAHQDQPVNRHAVLDADDGLTTLDALGARQRGWWQRPDVLFPYLIRVDGRPLGFDLIAARPVLPPELDVDFVVHEFFVLHAARGSGAAEQAARQGLQRHRGRWEVVTYPGHDQAIRFWRRVLGDYCAGAVEEAEVDHPWGRKRSWRFDNR